ncbi:uncharacterized protein LOC141906708 isoform X2 [Tubulanus polymorphus]|uniref:uncharacterized protein LOC141906708 isoform X2 n=1 Tax=Tubulanus polymorphus TaxID=672921 RepID=UPI003DA2E441
MKNWMWLVIDVILLLTISFHSEAVSVRNKRNTAPDGVVLGSVNVLQGRSMLLSQEGKTVSITCKQSSSTATGVHFQLQVHNGTGGTWTPLPLTSSKPVWKIVPEAGKQYKCVATNSAGRKESKIYKSDVISIKINENPCKAAQFQSLACTCEATSKIRNPNIELEWFADGYKEGIKDFSRIPPGVNTAVKDGVINRNKMDYRNLIYSTLCQCRLWKYNGIELPEPLQKQILHQTKMDVTYFPAEIQTRDTFTGQPDIRNQGEVVEYICRTVGGRPDPTVIYQQKRRGSEQWEPIPDPQPRKVPLKGGLKGFDTTYKVKADFTLHNGTSFRCAVKENLTFPEPQQFNPIIVHSPDAVVLNSVNVLPGTRVLLSQEGKTVSITCKQSSSTATGVHFELQVKSGGTWTLIPTTSAPAWVFKLEAGKEYKCVATNSAGTKESQIYKSDVISIKINENPCKVAEFQSLTCTCEATSKIGNQNMAVKWYSDGFTNGSTDFDMMHDQGVNTPVKDGVINRNHMQFKFMIYAKSIQCSLWRYNGLILPRPLQNQILHQTRMDVTSPDAVVLNSVNVLPGTNILLSQEGKTVSITCKQSSSTTTDVHFQLHVNSGAGGAWTPLPLGISTVWVFKLEPGKQYKCVATNSAGTKESQIYISDVISIGINENPCKVAQFQSLSCTCEATSKIGNQNIKVKWYADGFTEGSTDIVNIHEQGVNTAVKDGVINRNQMDYRYMIYATLIQCQLRRYNGLILPRPLQNQILHQTKMDVTYFPDEIQTQGNLTGQPDIRTEGEVVKYICRTEGGRPDPTVIYQQKRRGSEQWQPIPDPQPRKVPRKGHLKGFDTTYKFKADFKLHNGTSFRCAVKENLTFPEPRQFNPIVVHYFAPVYKKSSENETHAAYNVTVNSNPLTQQVTCDPPAVVQKLSNYQWNITIPIVNSTTTDYRGRCLADGINERVIDVAGYHNAGPTDEPVLDHGGGSVAGAVIGILLILLILIILFILWRHDCLRCRKPDDQLCRCGNLPRLGPKPEDVNELLRWTSETWYEKDHENWMKTRDQLQPEIVRIIGDVYETENDWEITRDKDKQAIAIREYLFQRLSHDQSMLDLVKEILRKYFRIKNLKMKLSNEIDTLLNEKRSIDGADAVYNRDEDEVHVSLSDKSNEEKRPLTNKEKEFIKNVGSAVESIVDYFAKMSDAELCERGIANIKPTVEIAEKFVKETLNKEVKQQNENLVRQIDKKKVSDETQKEMGVADQYRFSNKDVCESVLSESSLQILEENNSTELDKSIYKISRNVLEIKLKIAVIESTKELYAGRAERFLKELEEKLKQEENEERKNEEELNRIIHSSVCQAFKYITDMNEMELKKRGIVVYSTKDEIAMFHIKQIIANRIPGFKDSLETILKEKCKEARSSSSSKQWEYDISRAMSELSKFTSKTLKTNTGYWKQVQECFGDEIDSETNTTELTETVDKCLGDCIEIVRSHSASELKKLGFLVEESNVTRVRRYLEETYKRMIDVEEYKEVWWSDKFINFNDIFTKEHAKIRPRKQGSEEQSVILPDDFEKLFTYDVRAMNRVCLVGEPGMGKTTQIVNQVLSWERSPFLKRFPMLFYIPLNELPADNACIYTYIYKHLLNRVIEKDGPPFDGFKEFVQENAEKSIFLLDSFDELKNDKAKEDIVHVTKELPKAHIVITTRESGGSKIVTDPKFTVVSISGFEQEEVIDIMRRKFPKRDPKQLFNMLKTAAPPLFESIYYNPLILHMFCFLYMEKEEITIPSKLTDIYIDLTCFLISKREGFKLSKECFFGDIANSEALEEICQVAYETLIAHQNSFSENRLKLDESKRTALTCEEMSPRRKSDSSVQLRFIHKSVQEFLAAVHSVVQFNNSGEIPWDKCAFEQLPDKLEKYGELYPRFMAGLLYRYKYNRGLGELFKTLIDEHLKAVTIDEEGFDDIINDDKSFQMAALPDYERYIELKSESYWLSDQLSIYLNEADCPDDAISEIFQYIGKMLIVNITSDVQINVLAKILEHKRCPIEVVYLRVMSYELKSGTGEYCAFETAIASNTRLQGMIIARETCCSIDSDPYLALCQKSNSMYWFEDLLKGEFRIGYKKLDCDWIKTSRLIESEDDVQSITRDPSTQYKEEILYIKTEASGKIFGNIRKFSPSLKHLYLRVPPNEPIHIGLTEIIPDLKAIHLRGGEKSKPYGRIFNEEMTDTDLEDFNSTLRSSKIETIHLDQIQLTKDQSTKISDCIASMSKLKLLSCHRSSLEKSRILPHLRRLTVLSVDVKIESDYQALVQYLSSDAVNQLKNIGITSSLKSTEQHCEILRLLKNVSLLRLLEFNVFEESFDTQEDIDPFVKSIVELIENLPHLSHLYFRCQASNRVMMKNRIDSELNKLKKRVSVHLLLS